MARIGNGCGHGGKARGAGWGGPANGSGWGGPARGMGHNSGPALPFEHGNTAAVGHHSYHRSDRAAALVEILFDIAMNSPSEKLQLAACVACLDLLEGPPRAMPSK